MNCKPPRLSEEDQRFFFSLDDSELPLIQRFRDRKTQAIHVLLLGYFKVKPVVNNFAYHSVKADLKYIADKVLGGKGFKPFRLSDRAFRRAYERIFEMAGYRRWSDEEHFRDLETRLFAECSNWSYPRHLFDSAIAHPSNNHTAIPAYSTLQKVISRALKQHQADLQNRLSANMTHSLRSWLSRLTSPTNEDLKLLRSEANNQTSRELEKELEAHQLFVPHIEEIKRVVDALKMSPLNQQHYAEQVTYYGAKLKRCAPKDQRLFLLCYLAQRWEQALERIADGFLYQVEQAKQKAQYMQMDTFTLRLEAKFIGDEC